MLQLLDSGDVGFRTRGGGIELRKVSDAGGKLDLEPGPGPRIAGGAGSVTEFKLAINRTFTYKGKRESYLTASCPTGHCFTKGEVLFAGTKREVTHVLPCTPMG